mgnify:CR=1 FL=1
MRCFATRAVAWTKLHEAKGEACAEVVGALRAVFKNDPDPRIRARALWLIALSGPEGHTTLLEAMGGKEANIRIAAVRRARQGARPVSCV